jgi:hypothetical protein
MMRRRSWWFAIVAISAALAACRDAAAPPLQPEVAVSIPSPAGIHMLRQAPGAPALETYQVSFWACDGEAAAVAVNYLPVAGQTVGQPFLRFSVPKNSMAMDANGKRLRRGDSVLITLTIDPVTFSVDFQPSGVWFSNGVPAQLTFWYQNADPDFNADGRVDAMDAQLAQQLAVWGRAGGRRWTVLPSTVDPTSPSVSTSVQHFSEYAVSW